MLPVTVSVYLPAGVVSALVVGIEPPPPHDTHKPPKIITMAKAARNAGRLLTVLVLKKRSTTNPNRDTRPNNIIVARGGGDGDGMKRKAFEAAMVVTFRVTVILADPLGLTEAGFTLQVELLGTPEHASVTSLLKPPAGESRKSKDAVPPGLIAADGERATIEKSRPVPESATV